MEAEPLFAACELAFAVACEGEKSIPPIRPPAAMHSYLYLPHLSRRAVTVAQRAINDDPVFRQRVASDATEQGVGRQGYLWLTRPPGWEIELGPTMGMTASAASTIAPGGVPPTAPAPPDNLAQSSPVVPSPIPPKPAPPASGVGPAGQSPGGLSQSPSAPPLPVPDPPAPSPVGSGSDSVGAASSASIEDELANLRGLVDELSAERLEPAESTAPASESAAPTEAATHPVIPVVESPLVVPVADPVLAETQDRELAMAVARINELEGELRAARQAAAAQSSDAVKSSEAAVMAAVGLAEASAREEAERAAIDAVKASEDAIEAAVGIAEASAHEEAEKISIEAEKLSADAVEAAVQAAIENAEDSAREATAAADAGFLKAAADSQMQLDELIVERDGLASKLSDLNHEHSLLTGAVSERDHLLENLEAINIERDDLAGQLRVAEEARIDLESELGQLSGQWQALQVELEQARASMRGTRSAFEDSVRAMSDGLSMTEQALAGSAPQQFVAGSDEPSTATESSEHEHEQDLDPEQVESKTEDTSDVGNGIEVDSEIESSDLAEVLDTYGFGSQVVSSTDVPSVDEPLVDEPSIDEPLVDEPPHEYPEVEQSDQQVTPLPGESLDADAVDPKPPVKAEKAPRFEIHIPDDISADPLAVIRHVVATDDVIILVDGDAVSEMGWPETPVATRREALVKYLGDLAADTGAAHDAVFSGAISDQDDLPVSRAVKVRITAPGIAPSEVLTELVDSYPSEWPIAVVSDEPGLAKYAMAQGATLLGNGQLLDLLFDRWEATQED